MANAAPQITSVVGPSAPLVLGSAATVTAEFADIGTSDSHECSFSWDDDSPATTVTATGLGNGSCSAIHMYAEAGIYTVNVEVTDDDKGTTTKTYEFVVIYDPSGAFVTGGGSIDSPPAAYMLNSSLMGKAHFGFNAKYEKDGSLKGETEFELKDEDDKFKFHSTNYDWLVVSGASAVYVGSGRSTNPATTRFSSVS